MRHSNDPTGFFDAILSSDDDFEPYGFAAPRLATHDPGLGRAQHWSNDWDRVIELGVLRQLGRLD